jgi:hypothetical protein
VNAAIPTVVFEAKDASGNDLVPVDVKMDGKLIAERLDGTALSIDPGEHAFTFASAGKTSVQKHFVIHEGEKNRRERIVFAPASVAAIAPSVTRPEAILATTATMAPAPPDSTITLTPSAPAGSADWRRPAKWAAFGLAAVGIGVGVVETLTAIKKSNDFNSVPDNCMDDGNGHIRGGARCEQINHDQTFATWTAAIAYGLGGALAATGLILHLGETQPAKQGHTSASVACGVSASLAGATCVGHW